MHILVKARVGLLMELLVREIWKAYEMGMVFDVDFMEDPRILALREASAMLENAMVHNKERGMVDGSNDHKDYTDAKYFLHVARREVERELHEFGRSAETAHSET